MKYLYLLLLCIPNLIFAQESASSLFSSDEVLHIQIKLNVKETITDKVTREEHEAVLYYEGVTAQDSLNIKLTVRGNTRAKNEICKFPPLKVNFKKKQVKGTIFEGQNKIKLVTHCNTRDINEQYILREHNIYKLHKLVTPFSFGVRLVKISYIDTNGKYENDEHFGFFIEDIDAVAERNSMEEYEGKLLNQDACYREEMDRLTMFQFMIGNLDWSVPNGHNFKLIYGKSHPVPVAVPYDFDFSGMVNTGYAQPPEGIDVSSVRERKFRGFCRQPGTYEAVAQFYIELKPEIYSLYTTSPYLSEKSVDYAIKYLDSFYEVLDNPKQFSRAISSACRIDHKHIYEN